MDFFLLFLCRATLFVLIFFADGVTGVDPSRGTTAAVSLMALFSDGQGVRSKREDLIVPGGVLNVTSESLKSSFKTWRFPLGVLKVSRISS